MNKYNYSTICGIIFIQSISGYINSNNDANPTVIVGIAIIAPYLINVINENLISYLFNSEENMIPAKAPIGVRKAPILEPIIEL